MTVKRSVDLLDVLDRVLDRGVVIEVWAGVSVAGIRLVDVEARVLVASCPTYLSLADAVADAALVARPALDPLVGPAAPPALPASRLRSQRRTRQLARPRRAVRRRRSTLPVTGPRRTWICDHGCTLQRAGRWQRAAIPCPYDKGARCPVRTV